MTQEGTTTSNELETLIELGSNKKGRRQWEWDMGKGEGRDATLSMINIQ